MKHGLHFRQVCAALFFGLIPLFALATGHTVTISSITSPFCSNTPSGSATASVAGGTGPFAYYWQPNGATTPTINNVLAGSYTCTVTDLSDNSTASAIANIMATVPAPVLNVSTTGTSCTACSGTATAIGSGGSPPFTYYWAPVMATSSMLSSLCQGTYTCNVTDSNGCTATAVGVVTNSSTLAATISSTPSGCSNCSGTAVVSPSGGVAPYSYSWSNAQTTPNASNLCPSNTVTCTITDNVGCSISRTVSITNSSGFTASSAETDVTCNNNGSVTANPIGGVPPFSYSWSNGGTSQTISNLSPGIYHVTITDATGCTASLSDTVNMSPNALTVGISTTPSTCTQSNGSGTAYANGGTPPYNFFWSNSAVGSVVTGLSPGYYFCTVNDNAGCVVTSQQQYLFSTNPMTMAATGVSATCNLNDGAANATPGNATPPVQYSWSNGGTTPSISNLMPGIYSLTATDANGCVSTDTAYVSSGCDNIITGNVYVDNNANCVFDGTDFHTSGYVTAMPGNYVSWINNLGNYSLRIPAAGNYTVTETVYGYSSTCPASGNYSINFASLGNLSAGNDFALHIDTVRNLRVGLSSGIARPGFVMNYYLQYSNYGSVAQPNVLLTLNYDPLLSFVSSSTTPTTNTAPQLTWNLGTLAAGQTATISVDMLVPTIQNGGCLGCLLNSTAQIDPIAGDAQPQDNVSSNTRIIQGSYDPNMKECNTPGINVQTGDIMLSDSLLAYTIHFQNTGTDTAFNIMIADTLSPYLDPATVFPGQSSHPYVFEMQNGKMRFNFFNIMLPDSNVNEPASHGFVHYTVMRQPGLPVGTVIENTAYIYFDFNTAVVTNTTVNTISNPLSVHNPAASGEISIFPNPFSNEATIVFGNFANGKPVNIELFDVSGRCVFRQDKADGNSYQLSRRQLPAGMYECRLTNANGARSHTRIIIQ